jgi:hypothetical protein
MVGIARGAAQIAAGGRYRPMKAQATSALLPGPVPVAARASQALDALNTNGGLSQIRRKPARWL